MELTILMPCLNESETIGICIGKAMAFLAENEIEGEVLVSDNGSSDGSKEIAESMGARVVYAPTKGYGGALIKGCQEANGKYVIMGDADDSYDFNNLLPFLEKLREGFDLVMGNRFAGGIEDGAMPWSHRYVGNPVLSFIGRVFFHSKIRDFHCGLRGYNKEAILSLDLQTTGMEYASEMVVMAELNGLRITEVPTKLKKDGRSRAPHLNTFRDGWRHLKFLLMYAPNWLFLYPGVFLLILGIIGGVALIGGQLNIFNVVFSINTLLYFMFFIILGFNISSMFLLVKLYAYNHNLLPRIGTDWNHRLNEDSFIFVGALICCVGVIMSVFAVLYWKSRGYGELIPDQIMKITIPAVTMIGIGVQSILVGFLMSIIKIKAR